MPRHHRGCRDQHVRETTSVIRDFRKEKLQSGEMYNFEEASTLFTDLEEEVRALVDKVGASSSSRRALACVDAAGQQRCQGWCWGWC